jgi:hypothetical protein
MIQLNNRIYFRLDLGNLEDVAGPETAVSLTVGERLGNTPPAAELTMDFPPELQDYVFHELTNVSMLIGFSEETAVKSRWQVAGLRKTDGGFMLTLTPDRGYITVSEYKAYRNTDSAGAIKEAVGKYFCTEDLNGKSTLGVSNCHDKMTWLRCQQTARDFVDEVWLHSYKAGSLMVPGITANILGRGKNKFGTFRLIDLCNRESVIEIRRDDLDGETDGDGNLLKDVSFLTDAYYGSSSALYNYAVGERRHNQFNIDTAESVDRPVNIKPVFNGVFNAAPQVENNPDFYGKREVREYSAATRFMNGNIHARFNEAVALNLNRLSKLCGATKMLQIADRRKLPIMIGDFIRVHSLIPGRRENSEVQSGDYVVTSTVTRVVSNRETRAFSKDLILSRDALDIKKHDGFFRPPK